MKHEEKLMLFLLRSHLFSKTIFKTCSLSNIMIITSLKSIFFSSCSSQGVGVYLLPSLFLGRGAPCTGHQSNTECRDIYGTDNNSLSLSLRLFRVTHERNRRVDVCERKPEKTPKFMLTTLH